jgi:hypothetical protein
MSADKIPENLKVESWSGRLSKDYEMRFSEIEELEVMYLLPIILIMQQQF